LKELNPLDLYPRENLHKQFSECAKSIGGKNYFLKLLETIREAKPHPLMSKNSKFYFSHGIVSWSKPIFKEKLVLLQHIRNITKDGNIFPKKGTKSQKSIMNLLRMLHPVTFHVDTKNKKDGQGFTFHAFDIINESTTRINPIFEAIFFSRVNHVKKLLNKR